MHEFRTKPIRSGPPSSQITEPSNESPSKWKRLWRIMRIHFVWTTVILVMVLGIGKMSWKIVTLANDSSLGEVIPSIFSEKIAMDENNHTNILLLGTGDAGHSGATLMDTIMVASIDHDGKNVSMLSIPRDMYIDSSITYGNSRINSVYEFRAENLMYNEGIDETTAYQMSYEAVRSVVSDVLDIPIHYYAHVNFSGFTDIVDAIGGVDILVEEAIVDPFYPAGDGSIEYQTFVMDSGLQHMDGDTALKYARSRKTTSDFDRAKRQQDVLNAIKEKALSLGVLASPSKLNDVYNAVQNNLVTDLNWNEMVYLAKMADDFERENVYSWVLNDNPLSTGGFLYTPEREFYEGAYVLVPYVSDWSDIQRFADLVLMHPEVHAEKRNYQIVNGVGVNGLATETLYYLIRYGFEIDRFGNAANTDVQTTQIYPLYQYPVPPVITNESGEAIGQPSTREGESSAHLDYLTSTLIPVGSIPETLPAEYSRVEWETTSDILIELGQDFADWMQANRKRFY